MNASVPNQSSARTRSGGRPTTARAPRTTIGRSPSFLRSVPPSGWVRTSEAEYKETGVVIDGERLHESGIVEMDLDSVQIGVEDVDDAARAYEQLLGVAPTQLPGGRRRFQLVRGAVELEHGQPGLHSIAFVGAATPNAGADTFHGITVHIDPPPEAATSPPSAVTVATAIDHVVVQTTAPQRAIALWRDRHGLRLALDREFPARGLRLIFFRSGGMTLEYACAVSADDSDLPDRFYGVSYRVPDVRQWHRRLTDSGLDVSDMRTGMRPGTSVVTVRSGTCGVPTLLIGDAV